jgi:hypothetical protein
LLKICLVLALFVVAVLLGWAVHPVVGVIVAVVGYGAIDGILTK